MAKVVVRIFNISEGEAYVELTYDDSDVVGTLSGGDPIYKYITLKYVNITDTDLSLKITGDGELKLERFIPSDTLTTIEFIDDLEIKTEGLKILLISN